ncbi:MAG: metallophosphoesterase [Halodesulfurarchaeum sp.]
MEIGVIADTHDNVTAVEQAVSSFESRGVEVVLHCGDVIAPPVVPFFEGFEVHAVLGNNDGEQAGLADALSDLGTGSELLGHFGELRIDGREIALLHGEDLETVHSYASSGEYDVVCYGHHHERTKERVGETLVLNPGAHFPTVPGEHRTVAFLDLNDLSVTFEPVGDVEE